MEEREERYGSAAGQGREALREWKAPGEREASKRREDAQADGAAPGIRQGETKTQRAWEHFAASGSVRDYLNYKGMEEACRNFYM